MLQVLDTVNPAEFARAAAAGDTAHQTEQQQQQGTAWTDEGDKLVDATIHLGAGDRRKFKLGGKWSVHVWSYPLIDVKKIIPIVRE